MGAKINGVRVIDNSLSMTLTPLIFAPIDFAQ